MKKGDSITVAGRKLLVKNIIRTFLHNHDPIQIIYEVEAADLSTGEIGNYGIPEEAYRILGESHEAK